MKKTLKIVLYILGSAVVFLLLLAGVTQTQFFRDRLRSAALTNLQSVLNADIYLGDLRGNLVSGFSVDSLALSVNGEPLILARRLDLRYNLFEIPGKTISINNITLVRPEVRLLRGLDGLWNFNRMIRPKPGDTSAARPLDWIVSLNRLEIQEGSVFLCDSAGLAAAGHGPVDTGTVEYHRFSLVNVNLVVSGHIKHDEKRLQILSLSFDAGSPDIRLKDLSGDVLVTPTESQVRDLVIRTDRSRVKLNALMRDIDLLRGASLDQMRRNPVNLSLQTNDIDLNELKLFIPQIHFLNGSVRTNLEASGEFGDLKVQKLELKFGSTELFLRGTVANLHNPKNLLLNVKLTESKISPADPLALMPEFELPDLGSLGLSTLNLEFDGSPVDFRTKFLLETAAGNIQTNDLALKIGGPSSLKYKGVISVQRLNLDTILDDDKYDSRLNGSCSIEGSGTALHNLNAHLDLRFDSSAFRGLPLTQTRISVDALDRKISGNLNMSLGEMSAQLAINFDRTNWSVPSFHIDGGVNALNLEALFHNKSYNSDLTMKILADGTGMSWNDLNGDFALDVSSSRFGDYSVASGDIHFSLDQHDSLAKKVALQSNIADFSLTGAFDADYLVRLLTYEVSNVGNAVRAQFNYSDSLRATPPGPDIVRLQKELEASSPAVKLDVQYDLRIKDLEPISIVTSSRTFNGSGHLTGTVKGNYQNVALQGDLAIDDFYYGNVDAGTLIQGASCSFAMSDLKPVHPLAALGLRLKLGARRVHVNRTEFDSLGADLTYENQHLRYGARTTISRNLRCALNGDATVTADRITFTPDRVDCGYHDMLWSADKGAVLQISRDGLDLSHLIMRRDTQEVSVQGTIGSSGFVVASADVRRLDLDNLKYFLTKEESGSSPSFFTGPVRASIRARGTVNNPEITATIHADEVVYKTVLFGELDGDFSYRDTLLTVRVDVDNHVGVQLATPDLRIAGTIPVNLALSSVSERVPDQPMNVTILSEGIQMSILDPLMPTFRNMSGIMRCDVHLGGSLRHPDYRGTIHISDCSFLFVPNNIAYKMEGTFQPEGERIKVIETVMRNVPEDERGGRKGEIHVTGDFSLRDLTPGDFNLTTTGQLLVVKESTRKSSLSVYGNLFVEIGPAGLHLSGSIENSLLKGNLLIRNSSLVFPPTQASVSEESALSVPLIFVDDTTRVQTEPPRTAAARYFQAARERRSRRSREIVEILPSKSFLDGVHYDLDIETTGGNTEIRMIFYPATAEELVATISGKFSITDDGKQWFGDLVVERAYYNFFKRFNAEGNIRFAGNFQNPELDIQGTYQGARIVADSTGSRSEKVVVNLKITGARAEPKLDISMTIDGVDYYSYKGLKSNDVQSDAIQFVVAGAFPLTTSQKNDVAADLRTSVGSSLMTGASSLLTGTLSEFLRNETGFINSVELAYGTGRTLSESTELRLSGVAFNGLWRYGGKILDDPLSTANFSLLYSFDAFTNEAWMRNLMFELERKVESVTLGQTSDLKRVNSARLFYRFSF